MPKEIPYGYCHCGCGQKTKIAKENRKKIGWTKGQPIKFICGHNARSLKREKSYSWKGGTYNNSQGYIYILQEDHPRAKASAGNYVPRSHLVVETIMEKYLPSKAVVHHVDENRKNDSPNNLVACENRAYHNLLHKRQRALETCGHANWLKCKFCKQYDDPQNVVKNGSSCYHKECRNKYRREHRQKIKMDSYKIRRKSL